METGLLVKTEPWAPANWQMAIAEMSLGISPKFFQRLLKPNKHETHMLVL